MDAAVTLGAMGAVATLNLTADTPVNLYSLDLSVAICPAETRVAPATSPLRPIATWFFASFIPRASRHLTFLPSTSDQVTDGD
ncbi:hypothetical protein Misp03_80890 [Microbispora sp. NBRC 16548]|nr:hypothetical protein Misp03_80890 [Microbispora sp. NBRC 16548]